jgi:hypothetical protein
MILEGYNTAEDLYLGLMKDGPEKITDSTIVATTIIMRCHFHLVRISISLMFLK